MSRETRIGDAIKVNVTLRDDGADHHPPCYIAHRGDIVYVKEIMGTSLRVAHEGNTGSFILRDGEYIKNY